MKVTVQKLPKSEVKLTVEVSQERSQKYLEQAAKRISAEVKIPGFRPGHAPLDVVRNHVGEAAIDSVIMDFAIPDTYVEAIAKEKVAAISRPRINILNDKPLKYEAVVAVYPEVEVTGYDKINITKKDDKVTDKDVEEVLNEIRKNRATFKEIDRAAKMGDRATVDFEGFDDGGAVLENTKSKNHPVILGDGTLIKGFEEEIVGLKAGEEKTFNITFPKDYFHKTFQNKLVKFNIKLTKLEEVVLPELNEEFIEMLAGEKTSIEEVKKNIKENLQHEKEHNEKDRRENEFLEEVIKITKVEIPETLLDEELDGMVQEFKADLESNGIQFVDYLKNTDKTIEDLKKDRTKEATKRLTLRFGLNKIFEEEKVEVTKEDLDHEISHLKELYPPKEQYKIEKEYKEGSYMVKRLENKLKIEKLFDKFVK